MFEKIIPELVAQRLCAQPSEKITLPNGKSATFDQKRFSAITPAPLPGHVLFVDGGNAPVFESPSARVEFVRVFGATYEGAKKVGAWREEGLVLLRNVTKDGKGYVEATGHGIDLSLLIPDGDEELRLGRERVTLAAVASLARFALECRFAAAQSADAALIVRDGALQANSTYEERELALLDGKPVAGLSKTNTLIMADGGSVAAMLLEKGPSGAWMYDLGTADAAQVFFVKLHEKSEYLFRLDIAKENAGRKDTGTIGRGNEGTHPLRELDSEEIDAARHGAAKVCACLAALSHDPVFLGYPYPLVEADQLARVSNRELETLKARFMVEAGTSWKELQRLARGSDAHTVLDRVA